MRFLFVFTVYTLVYTNPILWKYYENAELFANSPAPELQEHVSLNVVPQKCNSYWLKSVFLEIKLPFSESLQTWHCHILVSIGLCTVAENGIL